MATTFATSTIQLYTDALLAHLKARPGLKDVLISDGPPPISVLQVTNSWLMLGDVSGLARWAVINNLRRPKDEIYTLECLISVTQATTPNETTQQSAVNTQAMQILAEVEDELRGNPNQGVGPQSGIDPAGYVIASEITTPLRLAKRGNDTQREAAFMFGIEVKARL